MHGEKNDGGGGLKKPPPNGIRVKAAISWLSWTFNIFEIQGFITKLMLWEVSS